MKVNFDLKGKVAVITGGGGILCSEMARGLASWGVQVAVLDIKEDAASKVAKEIEQGGGKAIGIKANVLEKSSLLEARSRVLEKYSKIDILINGAGGNRKEATTSEEQSFFDLPEDAIQWVFNLNFLGAVLASQVFGEAMVKNKTGSIINISSMAAFRPLTKTIAYSAAKAAVSNFTQWLAVHLNQNYSKNLRVNAIAPGFLITEQNRYLLIDEKTGEETERGRKIKEHTPMGRYGEPEELLGAVIWLCSDAASFINGVVIPIDGGFSAYSGV
ncbi:MAG: hypothetical protein PWP57_251 [Candidatus Atribacteria bacterium]|nr:hypothetical protein [Candidatus Atribacteria bacterium]